MSTDEILAQKHLELNELYDNCRVNKTTTVKETVDTETSSDNEKSE